jgi:hypothetical protein
LYARLRATFEIMATREAMEVSMAVHSDHHATDTGDNGTALAIWMLLGLFAVAAVALWFYST